MPDPREMIDVMRALEPVIEQAARDSGQMDEDEVIDDWAVIFSTASISAMDRGVTAYVLLMKNGNLPVHRVVGLADVMIERCWEDDPDD